MEIRLLAARRIGELVPANDKGGDRRSEEAKSTPKIGVDLLILSVNPRSSGIDIPDQRLSEFRKQRRRAAGAKNLDPKNRGEELILSANLPKFGKLIFLPSVFPNSASWQRFQWRSSKNEMVDLGHCRCHRFIALSLGRIGQYQGSGSCRKRP
jgi:hypothetical protein